MRDGFAWVLWRSRELEGLGAVEGSCEPDFAGFLRVHLEECALEEFFSLLKSIIRL